MTNADKIRAMTDKELAEWIDRQHNKDRDDWDSLGVLLLHRLILIRRTKLRSYLTII